VKGGGKGTGKGQPHERKGESPSREKGTKKGAWQGAIRESAYVHRDRGGTKKRERRGGKAVGSIVGRWSTKKTAAGVNHHLPEGKSVWPRYKPTQ